MSSPSFSLTNPQREVSSSDRLVWLEPVKALALFWIFFNHVAEQLFGSPYAGNPDAHWPQFSDRVRQFFLAPEGTRNWGIPVTVFRDIAWLGDQGVSVFLILSGLTLTWSCLSARNGTLFSWRTFYSRRIARIYPIWITANLLLLFPLAIFGVHLSLLDVQPYLSLIGIRILPNQLYYGVSAWWFITLLLQLYLVFPVLWMLLQKMGPVAFGIVVPIAALLIRAIGLVAFRDYLDAWARGAIFITRLPEFAIGILLGWALYQHKSKGTPLPKGWELLLAGIVSFALGFAASLTVPGMTVAPILQGCGAFLIFYTICSSNAVSGSLGSQVGNWVGRHSLALFLVHQIFVRLLIPTAAPGIKLLPLIVRLLLALALSALAAVALERITNVGLHALELGRARWGNWGFAGRVAATFLFIWGVLIAGDMTVRRYAPLEASDLGWGERPSLQPDPEFGWKLHPIEQIRLRWISYDYEVHSNSLGFPGAEYSPVPPAGVQRILVTGDAFTSAEGVDTGSAWPRLLETTLNSLSHGSQTEVMNFAITGYGPNQYQKVVEHFVPIYHPNIVLIGVFINDYEDSITTTEAFRKSIGFGRPDPNGLAARLTFRQLAALVRGKLIGLTYRYVLRKPDPDGYFLGQFEQLEKGPDGNVAKGRATLSERLAEIKKSTDLVGARLLVVLIPSGPQVCAPEALSYWPKYTKLSDPYFDVTLPQRTTKEITGELGLETIDLLPSLRSMSACPYQPHNMHWNKAAHQLAAQQIASVLAREKTGAN